MCQHRFGFQGGSDAEDRPDINRAIVFVDIKVNGQRSHGQKTSFVATRFARAVGARLEFRLNGVGGM